jgi:hypothetical protein
VRDLVVKSAEGKKATERFLSSFEMTMGPSKHGFLSGPALS